MPTGKVKFWDEGRGFGFAIREGQQDAFLHVKYLAVPFVPHKGQHIEFDIVLDDLRKRERANNIRPADT